MRHFVIAAALVAVAPASSQTIPRARCEPLVNALGEVSRQMAGLTMITQGLDVAGIAPGVRAAAEPLHRFERARNTLSLALADFTVTAKQAGDALRKDCGL